MFPLQPSAHPQRRPLLPQPVSVGIDPGRSAVRVVALRAGDGGARLVGLASAFVDADAGGAARARAVRAAVREACRLAPWRPRRVITAVPAAAVLVRTLEVDALAGADDIDDAAQRIVRQLPVAEALLRVVWAPLDHIHPPPSVAADPGPGAVSPDARRTLVVVAVRREAVMSRQHLVAATGLGRTLVDVDAFAALRAAVCGEPAVASPQHLPLLVDVGSESIRLLAWRARQAPLLRVEPLPREASAQALATTVGALVAELRGLISPPPEAILLSGGGSLLDGVEEALAASTGLDCSFADPFAMLRATADARPMPVGAAAAPWATACGLALRGLA